MRLATLMQRLGTETAFEVMVPRSGAQARGVTDPPGDRRTRFRHTGQYQRGRLRAIREGGPIMAPRRGSPTCDRQSLTTSTAREERRTARQMSW